jgi:predicted small secreted protein
VLGVGFGVGAGIILVAVIAVMVIMRRKRSDTALEAPIEGGYIPLEQHHA